MATEQEAATRVSLIIIGRVQGVFYRASALEQAQSLSLTGWVQNLPDGSVELVAEGPRFKLEQLVEWCRRGPPDAEVEDVFVRWGPFRDEFRTFMITR
jgi:acylphosphatase